MQYIVIETNHRTQHIVLRPIFVPRLAKRFENHTFAREKTRRREGGARQKRGLKSSVPLGQAGVFEGLIYFVIIIIIFL